MEEFGWSEEKAQTKANRLIAPMLRARLENAYEYVTTKDMAGKTVQDTEAMQNELQQKAPDADVEEWLLPKMEGILGKRESEMRRTPIPEPETGEALPNCTTPTRCRIWWRP